MEDGRPLVMGECGEGRFRNVHHRVAGHKGPSHDLTHEQIHHRCEVEKALTIRNIYEMRRSNVVWLLPEICFEDTRVPSHSNAGFLGLPASPLVRLEAEELRHPLRSASCSGGAPGLPGSNRRPDAPRVRFQSSF